jgi:hypothetical protein
MELEEGISEQDRRQNKIKKGGRSEQKKKRKEAGSEAGQPITNFKLRITIENGGGGILLN